MKIAPGKTSFKISDRLLAAESRAIALRKCLQEGPEENWTAAMSQDDALRTLRQIEKVSLFGRKAGVTAGEECADLVEQLLDVVEQHYVPSVLKRNWRR